MTYPRFLAFDSLGATIWSSQAGLLGYFAGKAFADQIWVAFVVAFTITGIVALVITLRERRYMARQRTTSTEPPSS